MPVATGSPTIAAALTAKTSIVALSNGLTALVNGTAHGPRLYISADPTSEALEDWTQVDLARHHDEAAAGHWWAGKWQFFSTFSEPAGVGLCARNEALGKTRHYTYKDINATKNNSAFGSIEIVCDLLVSLH